MMSIRQNFCLWVYVAGVGVMSTSESAPATWPGGYVVTGCLPANKQVRLKQRRWDTLASCRAALKIHKYMVRGNPSSPERVVLPVRSKLMHVMLSFSQNPFWPFFANPNLYYATMASYQNKSKNKKMFSS